MNYSKKNILLRELFLLFILCISCFPLANSDAQQPEINDQYDTNTSRNDQYKLNTIKNDQYDTKTTIVEEVVTPETKNVTIADNEVLPNVTVESRRTELVINKKQPESFTMRICGAISKPIMRLIAIPKVSSVLRNIGTCIVNGAMELVTHYFPPPLIPLIATAAGMVIPFEPVVMLREKMPVASYRRAFKTALDGFMSTFDRFKQDDDEDTDPYMTRRFNRRFMTDSREKSKIKK